MRIATSLLLPLLATLIACPATAQEADKAIEEVVVTASRVEKPLATIPNTITVINDDDLQEQLSIQYDLSTVLGNMIPSFSPGRQKMTSAGESLRGRKPLYMIDGVPQSNPLRNGGRDGHTIDPSVVERVEVLHGANAIHGLGAAGGIINLITRSPAKGLQQNVRLDSGFQPENLDDSLSYGASYSFSNAFDHADLLASASYRSTGMAFDANGNIIGVDNTQGDMMDSQSVNLFLKSGYNWDDQRLELMVNHYNVVSNHEWVAVAGDYANDIPSGSEKGALLGEGARNKVLALSLNYRNDDFFGQQLRVQGFRQDFEATYGAEAAPIATFQDEATYGPDLIDQSQNNSEKLGVKITLAKNELASLPVNLVYGLDLLQDETWQALIQTGRTWVPETQYQNAAPFLQLEYTGVDNLTVTGGARYENSKLKVDDFTTLASYGSQFVEGGNPEFSKTLYNLGATYSFADNWRVFGNYSEAFSMPDVGRVLRGINTPDQSVESFLDLTPILTENTELGIEFNSSRLHAELSYFDSDSDFGQRLQRGDDGIYTVKREKTEVDGVEFSSSWTATDSDTFGFQYAALNGRYDSNADGRVDSDLGGSNISPDRANLSWSRQWRGDIQSRLQLNQLMDRDFRNSTGEVVNTFDGYTTVDLSAQLPAFGGTLALGIYNLTSTDFYTYYSQVNPNNRRNFKGIGRSYNLSWRTQF